MEMILPNQPDRVALYVRVSTEEQAEHGYSIEAQLELLRQYCQLHRKIVYKEYIDAGVSGKSVQGRKEMQSLLSDVKAGCFTEVIVWKVNRLARNAVDLLAIVEALHSNGGTLHSLSESFDSRTPIGSFILHMLGATAELERNTIIENTKLGMLQRAKDGFYCNSQILGYDIVPEGTGQTRFSVQQREASIVRYLFQLYDEGKGLKAIVNQVNREGYTTKRGKPFSVSTVRSILRNPVYIGKVRYSSLEGQVVTSDGLHEAIIPLELWERVQDKYSGSIKKREKAVHRDYPLTGILKCPACGGSMVAKHIKKRMENRFKYYHYYSCNRYTNKGSSVCKPNNIRADVIEQVVLQRIGEFLSNPVLIHDIVENTNRKQEQLIAPLRLELEKAEKELQQVQLRRQKYLILFEEDGLAKGELIIRLRELKEQLQVLSDQQHELFQQIREKESKLLPVNTIQDVLNQLKVQLLASDQTQTTTLLRSLVDKITINIRREMESVTLHIGDALRKQLEQPA
ncbi:recombinase family protein [Brevibacillus parabrevis]|jgi:Site-specific recombinases, DNA invertase Pin homologs|uniref:recombinase family protein n=1 Tax=Brevibacillus parabrevis TaxID=54914 RepID=UPI00249317CE|nr:recombinase family protein [Brevibacillus parabrevis]